MYHGEILCESVIIKGVCVLSGLGIFFKRIKFFDFILKFLTIFSMSFDLIVFLDFDLFYLLWL